MKERGNGDQTSRRHPQRRHQSWFRAIGVSNTRDLEAGSSQAGQLQRPVTLEKLPTFQASVPSGRQQTPQPRGLNWGKSRTLVSPRQGFGAQSLPPNDMGISSCRTSSEHPRELPPLYGAQHVPGGRWGRPCSLTLSGGNARWAPPPTELPTSWSAF